MNDIRHDPDEGWYTVPDGEQPWGKTVRHVPQPDGTVLTQTNVPPPAKPSPVAAFDALRDQFGAHFDNVDPEAMVNPLEPPAKWQGSTRDDTPPAPAAPDLRTVGDRVAACEQELAALWDNAGHNEYKRIELERRVEALEGIVAKLARTLTESLRHIETLADRSNAISEVCNAHTDLFHRMAGDGK